MNLINHMHLVLVAGLTLSIAGQARAEDAWTDLNPAVRYLKRTDRDQTYHVVTVQLVDQNLSLRATKHGEKGRTTTSFARLVNAVVAVNGDEFAPGSFAPKGLAVGDGEPWPGAQDLKARRFIACDADRRCEIEGRGTETAMKGAWRNVVGGDGSVLISNGVVRSAQGDDGCGSFCAGNRSWTAVGLDKPRTTLFLAVAEGQRKGPMLRELGLVLHGLGAHQAMSFDSGGNAAMVINGKRVNTQNSSRPRESVVSNHLGVIYQAPEDGCTAATRIACSKYGCTCVDGKCNGGFCPGDGCTDAAREQCATLGCRCIDMRCSGGSCLGTGCTAKATVDCQKTGCACVDGVCAGRMCRGSGCTTRTTKDCARYGCPCVDGACSGGYCPGTGCTERRIAECARTGCACVDGQCAGGHCEGTGCTPKQTENCAKVGCVCVDGSCSGGFCEGSGCTARQTALCVAKACGCVDGTCSGSDCPGSGCTARQVIACDKTGCGCMDGRCAGGKCTESGCAATSPGGCRCELGRAPMTTRGGPWLLSLVLVAVTIVLRRRSRATRRRCHDASDGGGRRNWS